VLPVKITNSDVIKSGERELIDTIIGDLDWDTIEEIVKNRHKLKIQDDVEYRQGDIIVHNNQVAYKLDFDVKMTLSLVFDRDGNYLSLVTSEDAENMETAGKTPIAAEESDAAESDSSEAFASDDIPTANPKNAPRENFSKMASHIAEMISDINDD
jgi:hypothetical protein